MKKNKKKTFDDFRKELNETIARKNKKQKTVEDYQKDGDTGVLEMEDFIDYLTQHDANYVAVKGTDRHIEIILIDDIYQ